MRISKRIVAVILIAVMAFMLSACERNIRTAVLGKWNMDADFMRDMLRITDETIIGAERKEGRREIEGSLEFLPNGTLILDMIYPVKTETKVEGEDEPVIDYQYKVVHEEYSYVYANEKLTVDNRAVNIRLLGNTLALNGNSRTLVVSKAK